MDKEGEVPENGLDQVLAAMRIYKYANYACLNFESCFGFLLVFCFPRR